MTTATIKLHLTTVRLNSQGYDNTGRYWGIDERLWAYSDQDWNIIGHLRAPNREVAKQVVRTRIAQQDHFNPSVKFYR